VASLKFPSVPAEREAVSYPNFFLLQGIELAGLFVGTFLFAAVTSPANPVTNDPTSAEIKASNE
jgi:hypothetical protein